MESNNLMNGVPNGNQMMGGNGAPNGNLSAKRKKLQPISNCVNIYDLRKLMGSWKMAGITYAQMLKVLRLYLGESGWMDIYGRYPYNNLYPIAKGMKFSSVTEFFKCIRRCKGFGFVYHGGIHDLEHLDSFFSELWHPADSQENAVYYSPLTESSDDNNNININNNIYNNHRSTQRVKSSDAKSASYDQAFTNFMFFLKSDAGAWESIIKDLDEKCVSFLEDKTSNANEDQRLLMMKVPFGEHSVSLATMRYLEVYVKNYMAGKSDSFLRNSDEGNKIWLSRVRNFPFMKDNIRKAVEDIRREVAADGFNVIRKNRPLCQFEYQIPNTNRRLYDSFEALDAQGNILPDASKESVGKYIPKDAPPRPSAHAEWDNDYQQWVEE